MKGLLRLWRRTPVARASRGQALVWAAVMLPSMLMITMLGLDMGRVVMVRRALQNSVDAAALAGAWKLPEDAAGATTDACLYVETNAVPEMTGAGCGGKADVTFPTATRITVTSVRDVVPMFGSIVPLDFATIPVGADATAMVGSVHTLCIFPLFQTQDTLEASGAWQVNGADVIEFNAPVIMKKSSDGSFKGNRLLLEANGGSGANEIKKAFASPEGCLGGRPTNTVRTAPGNMVGPLDDGLGDRRDAYMNPMSSGYCPDMQPKIVDGLAVHPNRDNEPLTPQNCYRMVQFPLLNALSTDMAGRKTYSIRGFLSFYISNWCGKSSDPDFKTGSKPQTCEQPGVSGLPELQKDELWGYYLRFETVTNDPVHSYDGFGTKVVVLVE